MSRIYNLTSNLLLVEPIDDANDSLAALHSRVLGVGPDVSSFRVSDILLVKNNSGVELGNGQRVIQVTDILARVTELGEPLETV